MLIKLEKPDVALDFLKDVFLINENIIGIIQNMPNAELFVDDLEAPTGVLVNKDGYMHYVYTDRDSFINNISANYFNEGFFGFSGVEGKLAEKIRQRNLLGWESRCTLYYMPKENLDISLKKNKTERIRLEDAETVNKFYPFKDDWSLETIKRDITNRPSSAVYINDEIVCWVLIHDDNSMGIMYTKEEHRRKGYAVDVTIDLAQQIIEMGKIPFIQIIEGNGMSPGLAKKCGFVEAGKADWFGIITGNPKELAEANEVSRQMFLDTLPKALHKNIYKKNTNYTGLYYYNHNLKYQAESTADLKLVKVGTEELKREWCSITASSLDSSAELAETAELLYKAAEDPNYVLYMLQKDNTYIAAAATHKFEEGDRGIYLLSALPGYEDHDTLKRFIIEIIHQEKINGCFFMVTQAEGCYKNIFKELGFRESHKF